MEPYRQHEATSNPRVEIYDSHSPQYPDQFHAPPEPYASDSLLSRSAYGAPGYVPPSAEPYQHIEPENRLLPMEHDDANSTKRRPRHQISRGTRVTWRVLSLLLCTTIIGLIGHILKLRDQSASEKFKNSSGAEVPAWPDDGKLKLYPTSIFLGAAIIAVIINIIALLLVDSKHLSKLRPLISIPSTFIACALWLGAVVYFKSWDKKGDSSEFDLWTWTCTHKDFEVKFGNKSLGFKVICDEMTYVYYAGVAIANIEFLNLFAQIWNILNSRRKPANSAATKAGGGGWGVAIGGAIGGSLGTMLA